MLYPASLTVPPARVEPDAREALAILKLARAAEGGLW